MAQEPPSLGLVAEMFFVYQFRMPLHQHIAKVEDDVFHTDDNVIFDFLLCLQCVLLLQFEDDGQVELDADGRTLQFSGFPFGHGVDHAKGFLVAAATNAT